MFIKEIPNEYQQRVTKVINYILNNLSEKLSLETLAKLANYSPFHFQKIFKLVMEESPKQYIIRMRLQTAAHSLIVHSDKSITEIALDSGFSSSATFARAFKKYYGISAEEYRSITHLGNHPNIVEAQKIQSKIKKPIKTIILHQDFINNFEVNVEKFSALKGIFVNSKLNDSEDIQNSFAKVVQLAETHDLLTLDSKIIGVVYPHHNLYRAVVTVDEKQIIPPTLQKLEISSGKYAIIKAQGDFAKTFETLVIFSNFWLKKNGYQIANIYYFETFAENPSGKIYENLEKEIYNPIIPIK